MTFDDVANAAQTGGEIAESWLQGRTLFGGVLAAAAFRSLDVGERPLHSMQGVFMAPGATGLRIEPEILRAGKSMTFARAEVHTERGINAQFNLSLIHI